MKSNTKEYHYAIDAAQLILKCRQNLHRIIYPSLRRTRSRKETEADGYSPTSSMADDVNPNVLDLDRTLLSVEQLIHYHLLNLVEHAKTIAMNKDINFVHFPTVKLTTTTTLASTVDELKKLSNCGQNRAQAPNNFSSNPSIDTQSTFMPVKRGRSKSWSHHQSERESSTMQNRPMSPSSSYNSSISPASSFSGISPSASFQEKSAVDSLLFRLIVILQLCLVRIEEAKLIHEDKSKLPWLIISSAAISTLASSCGKLPSRYRRVNNSIIKLGGIGTFMVLRKGWMKLCLNTRLLNTSLTLEDWQQQWVLIQSVGLGDTGTAMQDEQCKHLLTLIPSKKSYGSWGGGSFRYNLIQWFMDTVYSSVGFALNKNEKRSIWMPITAAAAASYYAIVGPGWKSAEVLSSTTGSESSDLIQNTWGMVSLPVVKTLSLQASRLLKGAAIAERIEINGVSCFILSKDPCLALSTAINRYRRQQRRDSSNLGTILEEQLPSRTVNLAEYPRKDVIFHLTGGGFFAHTLAGDIPFLMDWSGVTKSIVIAIEYALLPDHKFPRAIEEVTDVYCSLVSGKSCPLLGFHADRIIVTGESTGGNLATSLCVKLCMDGLINVENTRMQKRDHDNNTSYDTNRNHDCSRMKSFVRLPDALLLCCPALNLSLELSPSRVITHDAVLPSALINTISNEYLGDNPKTDPLASPVYAHDSILSIFPPTLMYVSSQDPFLDDAVVFNKRLKRLGVECDLRAAQNLPHAYWGLGTAGFPEAKRVQRECEAWMTKQLSIGRNMNYKILSREDAR